MLVAKDVPASASWYCDVLGAENAHPGDEFAMIMLDGRLVVMLHYTEFDEHPALRAPADSPPGVGVLLYFSVDDVEAAHARALDIGADVLDEPHLNPNAGALEFSLRDPDGYGVTVAAKRHEGPEA